MIADCRLLIGSLAVALIAYGLTVSGQVPAQPTAASQAPARDNASTRAGTGSIRGQVTSVESGAPIARALVRITTPTSAVATPTVATDDQGRYQLNGLAAGAYTVTASKGGYVALLYGQRRLADGGRDIPVAPGQTVSNVDFALPKGGVIVAHVTDDLGDPIAGANVRVMQSRFADGERQFVPVGANVQGLPTDGAGEVRVYSLMPGDYYVSAGSRTQFLSIGGAGDGRVYATTYYPGTTSLGTAQRVAVGLGQESDVRLALAAVQPSRIGGKIVNADGSPSATASVFLNFSYPGGSGGQNLFAQADGSFGLRNILPGDYSIDVAPFSAANGVQEFASMPIRVAEEDQTNLIIRTGPGGTAHGRIVFDTGSVPAGLRPESFPVSAVTPLRRAGGPPGRRVLRNDWTFDVTGLLESVVFRLRGASSAATVSGPVAPGVSGWYLKAVMLGADDVTDRPIDFSDSRTVSDLQIVLTQKQTTLEGGVVDDKGAAADYVVVLFPETRDQWTAQSSRIAAARPNQAGRFSVVGLPPGAYLAVAVDYLSAGKERDPELLARLTDRASRLTLSEGESKALSLGVVTY